MSGPGAEGPAYHAAEPLPDTAYTVGGRRHDRLLDMRYADCWPAKAHCRCGEMLWREAAGLPWVHTGRRPGETAPGVGSGPEGSGS